MNEHAIIYYFKKFEPFALQYIHSLKRVTSCPSSGIHPKFEPCITVYALNKEGYLLSIQWNPSHETVIEKHVIIIT